MLNLARLPIKDHEFSGALYGALGLAPSSRLSRISLALSGGVDSMALAYMWHRFMKSNLEAPYHSHFHAFVVDHRARPKSTEEARLVATRLESLLGTSLGLDDVFFFDRKIGSRPTILSLEWPTGIEPMGLKSFESKARTLRYQALGRACRDRGITSLLLAHHEDDNAEMALARLALGHKDAGLKGMSPRAQLPESRGVHGVYESGQYESDGDMQASTAAVTGLEKGGISVVRPLLSFPKSRLIATCREMSIGWVEDPTNHDPTLTIRNAARTLLRSGILPYALRKDSLLRLIRTSQSRQQAYEDLAQDLFRACKIDMFDIRTGTLKAFIPPPEKVFGPSVYFNWSKEYTMLILAIFVRRLAQFVTPREIQDVNVLKTVCDVIFGVNHPRSGTLPSGGNPTSLRRVGAGVLFELKNPENVPEGYRILYLHRQPLEKGRKQPTLWYPPLASMETRPIDKGDEYQLWDGRFWIQLENRTEFPLVVEPFLGDKSHAFKHALVPKVKRRLEDTLEVFVPARARWTLPCISIAPDVELKTQKKTWNRILALPTLGVVLEEWEDKIKWDIRYKKVHMPEDMAKTIVVPNKRRRLEPRSFIYTKPSGPLQEKK